MKIGMSFGALVGLALTVLGIGSLIGGHVAFGVTGLVVGVVVATTSVVLRLRYNRRWLERAVAEDDAAERAD